VNQEIHDALTGHAQASTVSGGYGAKEMLARFGVKVLRAAVAKVAYRGLDCESAWGPDADRHVKLLI